MDRRLFFLLNKAQKKMFRHVDDVCERELDASVTQLAALMMVAKQPGMQQKTLAHALDLNKSAVTGLVARMVKNGLLEKGGLVDDARAVTLTATPEGLGKVAQMKPLISALNARLAEEFNEDELLVIARFLNFIIETF